MRTVQGVQWQKPNAMPKTLLEAVQYFSDPVWSLLKRSVKGTYVSVERFHLFRYLDEQAYRFNTRKMPDGERFVRALHGVVGKRLTYETLTGGEATA